MNVNAFLCVDHYTPSGPLTTHACFDPSIGIVSMRKRCRVDFLSISGVGLSSHAASPSDRHHAETGAQNLSKILEDVGRIGHVKLVRDGLCSSNSNSWQHLLWQICFQRVGGEEARTSALCVLASTLVQRQGQGQPSAEYMASSVDRLLSLVSQVSPEWPAFNFGESAPACEEELS
jgi:hypothetical protein